MSLPRDQLRNKRDHRITAPIAEELRQAAARGASLDVPFGQTGADEMHTATDTASERSRERIADADDSSASPSERTGTPAFEAEVVTDPHHPNPRSNYRDRRGERSFQAVGVHHDRPLHEEAATEPPGGTQHGRKARSRRDDVNGNAEPPKPTDERTVPEQGHRPYPPAPEMRKQPLQVDLATAEPTVRRDECHGDGLGVGDVAYADMVIEHRRLRYGCRSGVSARELY
jgi:hypothetical protein